MKAISLVLLAGMLLLAAFFPPVPPGEPAKSVFPVVDAPARPAAVAALSETGLVPPIGVGNFAGAQADPPVRFHSEPHGHDLCASGCAVSHHPTPTLARAYCAQLLDNYQATSADAESKPLDELLFYGDQVVRHLRDAELAARLDAPHLQFLRRELRRSRVSVAIRIVDEHDRVRADFQPAFVPQHVRQVFDMQVAGIQPMVCSGTVKRVGLNYVWQRL